MGAIKYEMTPRLLAWTNNCMVAKWFIGRKSRFRDVMIDKFVYVESWMPLDIQGKLQVVKYASIQAERSDLGFSIQGPPHDTKANKITQG